MAQTTKCFLTGVEFGARMITIDGKQIKLQIWDTVRSIFYLMYLMQILIKKIYKNVVTFVILFYSSDCYIHI